MKNKKKKVIIGGMLISVCLGSYFVFFSKPKDEEPSYHVQTLSPLDPLLLKGEINAEQTQDIFYDQALGTIADIPVKHEQEVTSEDTVLTYQNSEAQSRTDQQQRAVNKSSLSAQQAAQNLTNAQSRYNDAQTKLEQTRVQAERESDPEKQEELKSNYEQQKAELPSLNNEVIQAQQALDIANTDVNDETATLESEKGKVNVVVKAAINGVAMVNEAGKKSLDTPVIQILSKTKQVKGTVSEYDLNKLKTGQEVNVTSIGSSETVTGKVTSINQLPKKSTGTESEIPTYEFTVDGNFVWPYGSSVQVSLQQPQLLLPASAVITEDKKSFVFVYKNHRAVKTEVTIADVNGAKQVESGISKGTKIISDPDDQLNDQAEVQVVEND